jgi:REP element-mobilizing transposase RayT
MSEPLAYHLTWQTYGSWLPGDARGWVKGGKYGIRGPQPFLEDYARRSLKHAAVALDGEQRGIVEWTVREHCRIRQWILHAVNPRSTHVHVVVTTPIDPNQAMGQLKAWCSRRLSESTTNAPERWWASGGSTKWINDERYLEEAIKYVLERQ